MNQNKINYLLSDLGIEDKLINYDRQHREVVLISTPELIQIYNILKESA